MNEPLGQILPDSPFGKLLTGLAKRSKIIVEVGTWHGEGSTRCLANGLVTPEQRLYTIESDQTVSARAALRFKDSRITFLAMLALTAVEILPAKIDLLLLDGSDDTTDNEFDTLHQRCQIIALDDTERRKNSRQLVLLKEWKWTALAGFPNERNGWAVFERPIT